MSFTGFCLLMCQIFPFFLTILLAGTIFESEQHMVMAD
ncbi:hypothetical protein PLUTE_a0557 [Pseudoalteromonas luteoviolacea DSM 6061]|nr:hypothetical protein [Pseudoalteromonas luteoviolacea DSM 6061]